MAQSRIALIRGHGGLGESISTRCTTGFRVVVTIRGQQERRGLERRDEVEGYDFHPVPVDVAIHSCQNARTSRRGRPDRHPGEQRRHHARHDVQEDGQPTGRVMKNNLDSVFNMSKPFATAWWIGLGPDHQRELVKRHEGAFGRPTTRRRRPACTVSPRRSPSRCAQGGHREHISPGYIGTKMVTAIPKGHPGHKIVPQDPVGRLGKPEEVAGLIIICAPKRGFVTARTSPSTAVSTCSSAHGPRRPGDTVAPRAGAGLQQRRISLVGALTICAVAPSWSLRELGELPRRLMRLSIIAEVAAK